MFGTKWTPYRSPKITARNTGRSPSTLEKKVQRRSSIASLSRKNKIFKTREVNLRVTRDIQVSLPGNRSYTLPPGVHVGYIDEAAAFHTAMLRLDDAALIKKLGLTEQARPINFE